MVKQLSNSCQAVVRQSSGSSHEIVVYLVWSTISKYTSKKQAKHIYVNQTIQEAVIKHLSRFVTYCAAYGTESLFSLVTLTNIYSLLQANVGYAPTLDSQMTTILIRQHAAADLLLEIWHHLPSWKDARFLTNAQRNLWHILGLCVAPL